MSTLQMIVTLAVALLAASTGTTSPAGYAGSVGPKAPTPSIMVLPQDVAPGEDGKSVREATPHVSEGKYVIYNKDGAEEASIVVTKDALKTAEESNLKSLYNWLKGYFSHKNTEIHPYPHGPHGPYDAWYPYNQHYGNSPHSYPYHPQENFEHHHHQDNNHHQHIRPTYPYNYQTHYPYDEYNGYSGQNVWPYGPWSRQLPTKTVTPVGQDKNAMADPSVSRYGPAGGVYGGQFGYGAGTGQGGQYPDPSAAKYAAGYGAQSRGYDYPQGQGNVAQFSEVPQGSGYNVVYGHQLKNYGGQR